MFLIDHCQDLSANARQGSTLDNPCEVPAVLLIDLLCRLKLLFGMPLRHLVPQVDRVSLLFDVLGALVADEDDNGVDVHMMQPLNGMRADVQKTVPVLFCDLLY